MTKRSEIPAFIAMEVAREANARAAAGENLARLDVGQPHFAAPEKALRAAEQAMRRETMGYSEALGRDALRRALSGWYTRQGVSIDPARIVITTGASGAFTLAFLALFDAGARVALASPGYPPYRHILKALGFEAVISEARLECGLQLTAALLREMAPVDGALVASPANPTGAMLADEDLAALAAEAHRLGLPLISDEIYHGLTYDRPARTALAFDDDVFVIGSFSKYWAMTGWRVGWIVAPASRVTTIERLAQNLTIAPPTVSQIAALGALEAEDECEARKLVYARNRSVLLRELPGLGLPPVVQPDGAFYMLVDVTAHADDSMAFARRALESAGVAITPGVDFCEINGKRWARLAYCRPEAEIDLALERLARLR